jgi:adenylosuccinate lyase
MKYEKMMNNISPIDGRYKDKLKYVNQYFSEFGIIKAKIFIEVNYLKFISTEFSKRTQKKGFF